ncbi:variable surface protein [Plasmodium gonderi]|uniref:Variable surface protein n=1 Tax=Plasmodium gonderi TaxID=77519 RepID=A0A1Y1JNL9_PLAGO|nr:variable surface protein [Plasmodium gonderi]GAW84186.1 variable surface protein [Plasmodium gonderi]
MQNIMSEEFEFNGIFPECEEEYNKAQTAYPFSGIYLSLNNHIDRSCMEFINDDSKNYNCDLEGFFIHCRSLGRYLYHIQIRREVEKKKNCIYFGYLLKKLLSNLNCKNNEAIQAACNRINNPNNNYNIWSHVQNFRDICNEYNIDLDDTFDTLVKLENMVNKFDELRKHDNSLSITEARSSANEFKEMLKEFSGINVSRVNRSLNNLLDEYNVKYDEIMKRINEYDAPANRSDTTALQGSLELLSVVPPVPNKVTKGEFTEESRTEYVDSQAGLHLENMTQRSKILGRGMWAGIAVFIFAISIVIFILYKNIVFTLFYQCTPNGYKLKSCIRNLKSVRNKRSIERFYLRDSVEKEYKNFVDNKYGIAYSSAQHPRYSNNKDL